MKHRANRLLFISVWVMLLLCGTGSAQPPRTDRIGALINGLNDKREFDTQAASGELIKIGRRVLPRLISSLKTRNGCNFKVNAARVVLKLDPQQPSVKSALFDVATYKCKHSLTGTMADKHEFILNINAAMILAEEVDDGLPVVAKMFSDKSPYVRQNAARALMAFAWSMDEAAKENRAVSETKIAAFKAALPLLVKALSERDEFVRCSTYAALSTMQKSAPKELQVEAARALQSVEVRCPKEDPD